MSSSPAPACPTFDPQHLNLPDAEPVGSGAVSQVVHSKLNFPPYTPIAVKIVSKVQLLQQNKTNSAMNEKRALLEMGPHPFIVRLFGTAQSTDELYFVMEHLPNGDLLEHIRTCASRQTIEELSAESTSDASSLRGSSLKDTAIRCLNFHDIQLITAQIVMGLTRVFRKGFVLRDLKPENIVFDHKYRACLVDFDTVDVEGTSFLPKSNGGVALPGGVAADKKCKAKRRLTVSAIREMRKMSAQFCGTAQYVSPEMIGQCQWSYSSDLWALGTIVYEMVYGVHMFAGCNAYAVMKRVLGGVHSGNIPFPNVNLGPESDALDRVKDFICRLCRINPTERLGVHPVTGQFDEEAIRGHPFFGDFSWSLLDEQVQHYRAPVVLTTPSDSGSVRTPAVQGPLHPQLLDDGTASLKSRYHVLPVHSKEYAEYVFEATADANPFERWMRTKVEDPTGVSDHETTKHNASFVEDMPIATPVNDGDVDEENSDEYSDVVDDVGMQFFGVVHPDFLDIA
ncbi:putative protein kinase [Trypanosoma cruzi]|uniref:non-specific serine/threonine protein kinase n=2 Tax=Trypanosoma cruzi TaxID=5693 RepID=Q4DG10_TRYCC|nr:protein kinase, putative [Trypanosoma cruzi]EAN91463.1 protein kinase, putative [Trypanosoma cruzi]PWV08490.1 putative protein kinase [Trypanosoma cruzi]RNC49418.1 putative protein kinase [Trypanosoma cruzi]|eukprot:XP_813314.1 protein kinase [Trypanosoma cruzi strain CL Brener]